MGWKVALSFSRLFGDGRGRSRRRRSPGRASTRARSSTCGTRISATDPVSGEVLRGDVTLNVAKSAAHASSVRSPGRSRSSPPPRRLGTLSSEVGQRAWGCAQLGLAQPRFECGEPRGTVESRAAVPSGRSRLLLPAAGERGVDGGGRDAARGHGRCEVIEKVCDLPCQRVVVGVLHRDDDF